MDAHVPFDCPPKLANTLVRLVKLQATDFERLFAVAADPSLWEQHPNPDRYKREVFEVFFAGAIKSKCAYLILDAATGEALGSSRYYDYSQADSTVHIGYTFVARKCWGKGINMAAKNLMLEHAFQFTEKVLFHVGASNVRSQKAMAKIGAAKAGEIEVSYYGEAEKLNFVYEITRSSWRARQRQ